MAAGCATLDKDECRTAELDRLEALTREAQQVETRIQQFR
jgi:hypothetical protein